jgi:transposase
LWYKRLEKGCFRFPAGATADGGTHVEVKAADLMMILDGVDLGSVRRQRRYSRETVGNPQ